MSAPSACTLQGQPFLTQVAAALVHLLGMCACNSCEWLGKQIDKPILFLGNHADKSLLIRGLAACRERHFSNESFWGTVSFGTMSQAALSLLRRLHQQLKVECSWPAALLKHAFQARHMLGAASST